ncbi:MAG: hypothetical protein HOA08_10055 [Rhodospirillaceae bacterium]|jgi:hypothetical protein|nr:hypothetical protein [Rhodospirillaceae bacterium]MBT3493641.1 hypothetical protein [Rhodospirillaceae bacterium]MBT3782016.1 hypothetical protein [Rhodospirillaceae bacterium]MBT3977502.1 hypothetical protein [Rhodospirillaceae bacterium]MBT4171384.1 hypothetical protein [Rhodospirillaceae bacterium]
MSLQNFKDLNETASAEAETMPVQPAGHDERRATGRAGSNWQAARGAADVPSLISLGVGDMTADWSNRFLIRGDEDMPHAVFIACGDTLQSEWQMERLGETLEDSLPVELCSRFAEGCRRSLEEGCPVPVEGSYRNEANHEVLFRCVMMPVRAMNDAVEFVYGAYSHRLAA